MEDGTGTRGLSAAPATGALRAPRHAWLLAALVLMLAESPTRGFFKVPEFVHVALFSAVLVASVYSAGARGRVLWTAIALGVPAMATEWAAFYSDEAWLTVTSALFVAAFLGYAAISIVRHIGIAKRVSVDTILGGVVVYLLIGTFFMVFFALLEFLEPGSFSGAAVKIASSGHSYRGPDLLYFSFVTLTTLGYGDIQPVSEFARTLSFLEALIGQLYLTVMIAWLVGMHISQAREEVTRARLD